jgi:L-ribulose-5-phosphate 3-epimerase UlaE
VIGEQFPFEPLQFLPKSLRLTFAEGIQMLQEAGYDVRGESRREEHLRFASTC